MVKPRLAYYSDCPFFAGCENMLANFFQDPALRAEFEIRFIFRDTPEYRAGLKSRVPELPDFRGLKLPTLDVWFAWLERMPKPIRAAGKAAAHLSLLKYVFVAWAFIRLYRYFRQNPADLLHVNNGGYPGAYSAYAAVMAARAAGVPRVVYVVNNLARSYRSPARWLDYPLDRVMRQWVDLFVTGSRPAAEALRRTLDLPAEKVRVLPNGIQTRPARLTETEVRRLLEIPDARPLLSQVALLVPRKGHRYLLQALALIRAQRPEAARPVLACMGSGPLAPELKALALALGIEADVRWIDDADPRFASLNQNRGVFSLLAASAIVALPSVSDEDFPNVVLEAMSLGKPVVATSISGIPDQIQDGVQGWLVPPRDPEGLAAAILALLGNAARTAEMGREAQVRFNERYTATRSVERYRALYASLA